MYMYMYIHMYICLHSNVNAVVSILGFSTNYTSLSPSLQVFCTVTFDSPESAAQADLISMILGSESSQLLIYMHIYIC